MRVILYFVNGKARTKRMDDVVFVPDMTGALLSFYEEALKMGKLLVSKSALVGMEMVPDEEDDDDD